MNLRDSVCVVTGASSGIGKATALEMARRGAIVALSSHSNRLAPALEEVLAISPSATMHLCDVGDRDAVAAMIDDVIARHGRIDVLFANAGFGHFKPLVDMTNDEVEEMVRTNVLGQIWCTKAVLPHMMERKSGHIVVMASTNGRIPPPLQTVYNATKFAAVGFGETLLYEVETFGIGVSIVYPGAIDTAFFEPEEFGIMRTPKKIPVARVGRAVCDGIERGSYDISIPRSLKIPAVMRALFPPLIRKGIRRYGASVVPRPPA